MLPKKKENEASTNSSSPEHIVVLNEASTNSSQKQNEWKHGIKYSTLPLKGLNENDGLIKIKLHYEERGMPNQQKKLVMFAQQNMEVPMTKRVNLVIHNKAIS